MEESEIVDPPLGIFFILLFGFWAGWGALIFQQLASESMLFRLPAAFIGGYMLMIISLTIVSFCFWERPMTAEERTEWEEENAERAARIRAAREARERKLRQVKKRSVQLIAEMEADPMIASMLRIARQRASKNAGEELLTKADIAIAGLGSWLTEQGVANQLPGHWLGGVAKGKIGEHFSSLSSKERKAFQKYLPRVARMLEEALEVMSPREVVETVLLPLFFGETANQAQDK